MKNPLFRSVIVLGILLVSGCSAIPTAPTVVQSVTPIVITEAPIPSPMPPIEQPGLTDELLRNSTYLSPQVQGGITLVNGKFSGQVNGIELNAVMNPEILRGDINGDGIGDAAFLLSEDTGGSGVFVSLMIVYSENGAYTQAPGYFIEDRPVIEGFQFENGEVILNAKVHAPNDPMVDPTLPGEFHFDVFSQAIILTRLTTGAGDGATRSIYIAAPEDGQVVSGSVTLTGSMPIGPFENNLSFRILDLNGQQLFQSGFMVQAEDMGKPATFNNTIDLTSQMMGQQYILELSELSMANGLPLAVDTVLIAVQ